MYIILYIWKPSASIYIYYVYILRYIYYKYITHTHTHTHTAIRIICIAKTIWAYARRRFSVIIDANIQFSSIESSRVVLCYIHTNTSLHKIITSLLVNDAAPELLFCCTITKNLYIQRNKSERQICIESQTHGRKLHTIYTDVYVLQIQTQECVRIWKQKFTTVKKAATDELKAK